MSAKFLIAACVCLAASPGFATIALKVAPTSGHPGLTAEVNGTGFGANEAIDIYFDTTDELLVVADTTGKFATHNLSIPKQALPGVHWITAIGRRDGDAAQKPFTVATDWNQHGFNSRGKRFNPYENVLDTTSVPSLDVAWEAHLGSAFAYSSPVVADGVVYAGWQSSGVLAAFDESTGTQLWAKSTGEVPQDGPAVSGNAIYFGTVSDGTLYALNKANGALLWSFVTGAAIDCAPTVAGGVVYIGSDDSKLYALDAATGALKWSTQTGNRVTGSPVVFGGQVYFGSYDGKFYALDAASGATIWTFTTGSGAIFYAPPTLANGILYIGASDGSLYALNAKSGVLLWSVATGALISTAPAVYKNRVYVSSASGRVWAVDASNGSTVWTTGVLGYAVQSSPAVANGVLYVGVGQKLFALDATSGVQLWSMVSGGSFASPTVVDGMVFAGSQDGNLYAYAVNGGDNAAYRKTRPPPAFASLHPDQRLKPSR